MLTSNGPGTAKRSPSRQIPYRCTQCGEERPKEDLTVKKVEFATIGSPFKRLKVRTVAWLCKKCRDGDPAWNQPGSTAAPGNADWNSWS